MATILTDYQQKAAFQPDRFNPVVISENERVKVILACFEAGQFIPVHHPKVDLTLVILQGEGLLAAGEQEVKVGPGAMAFIRAGEARGLKAESHMVALHIVSPPPTDSDHVEVMSKLQKGVWR
ncbi:MAG TPA: cupin domain-containing protein [Methylomirabilota bacterium]|jgi:quercetin dioxygenase-like cupin family protein|nr:cupin domain-containing protein [Methylomirabilota bacterium]